ncbi:MAG: hypothetical protein FJZ57_03565 [Chlamydiae bacterium]|nr:hypothetical protein [Chlamydiota bacterium]
MKNVTLLTCILMVFSTAGLVAAPALKVNEWSQNKIISMSELNNRLMESFCNGEIKDVIVECLQGTSIPLKVIVKGQFLALESTSGSSFYFKVLKTCYVRCEEKENYLFSSDLQTWKSFSDFFTGELKVSVEVEKGEPIVGLQLELDPRS